MNVGLQKCLSGNLVIVNVYQCSEDNTMPSKLSKWGNSLGVRLPSYVAERAGLRNGDYLYITLMDSGDIVIRPVKQADIHPGYGTAGEAEAKPLAVLSDEEVLKEW